MDSVVSLRQFSSGHTGMDHITYCQGLRQLRNFAILTVFIFLGSGLQAAIYKTVDENGNAVFTDDKRISGEQSEEIQVAPSNTIPAHKSDQPFEAWQEPLPDIKPQISITSPENDTTYQNPTEPVTVKVSAGRHEGSVIKIFHNGNEVASGTDSWTYTEMLRGSHTFIARIYDDRGKLLAESEPVTIYIHRTSVSQNPFSKERQDLAAAEAAAQKKKDRPFYIKILPFSIGISD